MFFQRLCPRSASQLGAQPAALAPTGLILIVEADKWNGKALGCSLEQAGYSVQATQGETAALELLKRESPTLLVVGGAPDPAFYRSLRRASSAFILALIPQGNEEQVLAAFAAGVDQCQTGYLSNAEGVARIRALLRRGA